MRAACGAGTGTAPAAREGVVPGLAAVRGVPVAVPKAEGAVRNRARCVRAGGDSTRKKAAVSAPPAVREARPQVGLTPVGRVHVAVAEPTRAGRDRATSRRTARHCVRERTGPPAPSAVVGTRREVGLAAVARHTVAVIEARSTRFQRARRSHAARSRVGERTGPAAGAAVHAIVHRVYLAARRGVAVAVDPTERTGVDAGPGLASRHRSRTGRAGDATAAAVHGVGLRICARTAAARRGHRGAAVGARPRGSPIARHHCADGGCAGADGRAGAAVCRVREAGLAAVHGVAIAVGEALGAVIAHRAGPPLTGGGDVHAGQKTAVPIAPPAVERVGLEVETRVATESLPGRTRGCVGRVGGHVTDGVGGTRRVGPDTAVEAEVGGRVERHQQVGRGVEHVVHLGIGTAGGGGTATAEGHENEGDDAEGTAKHGDLPSLCRQGALRAPSRPVEKMGDCISIGIQVNDSSI